MYSSVVYKMAAILFRFHFVNPFQLDAYNNYQKHAHFLHWHWGNQPTAQTVELPVILVDTTWLSIDTKLWSKPMIIYKN